MKNITNLVEASGLIQDFLIDQVAPIPDDVKAKLRERLSQNSPGPDACRFFLELIYARSDELPVELLQIGVQIAMIMTLHQQLGYQNGRGNAIASTLLAMPGVVKPVAGGDVAAPAPDPQFAAPADEPAPSS